MGDARPLTPFINSASASVSMGSGSSERACDEINGAFDRVSLVPIFGETRSCVCDSILAVRSFARPCIALRTLCRPRNICFSKRDRFSIMCSYTVQSIWKSAMLERHQWLRTLGHVTSCPIRIIVSSSGGSGSLSIWIQSYKPGQRRA